MLQFSGHTVLSTRQQLSFAFDKNPKPLLNGVAMFTHEITKLRSRANNARNALNQGKLQKAHSLLHHLKESHYVEEAMALYIPLRALLHVRHGELLHAELLIRCNLHYVWGNQEVLFLLESYGANVDVFRPFFTSQQLQCEFLQFLIAVLDYAVKHFGTVEKSLHVLRQPKDIQLLFLVVPIPAQSGKTACAIVEGMVGYADCRLFDWNEFAVEECQCGHVLQD